MDCSGKKYLCTVWNFEYMTNFLTFFGFVISSGSERPSEIHKLRTTH